MTNCGVGRVTRARSPEPISTSPILRRWKSASRTDGPADAEMTHQLALGRKPLGLGECAVLDHPLEMLRNVLGQPPLPNQRAAHLGIPIIPLRYD